MANRRFISGGIYLITALFLIVPMLVAFAQTPNTQLSDSNLDSRVNGLVQKMTLEEKIGQLVQYSAGAPTGPGTGRTDYPEAIAQGQIGSLFNLTGAKEVNAMQKIAIEKSQLRIPLIFGLDIIHGYRTTFPVPLGMSATWNPSLVEKASHIAAVEARQEGVRWTFSPMVDIARDARWGRIVEGSGEDTFLGRAMARAYVRGYQGTDLTAPDSILACLKHYVAYGAAEGGRDYNTADISDRSLRQVYLPPFKAGIDEGAATVMSAFDDLQGVPASANHYTLTDILRGEWGFHGFVVSDWNSVGELIPQGVATDAATAARKALTAGVDMDMESNSYATTLLQQVKSGAVPESVIDEAVRRILRVKFAMGLFDHPYADESKSPITTLDPAHVAVARQVAEESFVLLKNEAAKNGSPILPLASSAKTIALIGPLGDSQENMLGSWAGKGQATDAVTLRKALANRLAQSQGKLLYAKGTDVLTESESGFADAISAAKKADVVIAALGEDAGLMTGEAASRAHLNLPGNQEKLLQQLEATGKPIVLVVFSGRPLILNWEAAHIPAILEAWFPGVQAGPAIVSTLFGDVDPSGRLTTSFPRAVGQEPLYYNAMNTGRPAEGVDLSRPPANAVEKYRSRYIDEQNSPLYPFGYGLSYTKFQYSPVTLSASSLSADALNSGSAVTVTAEVKNTGSRPGKEVVQLYIRQQGTSVTRPVRELKGFEKIALAPGESRKIEFKLGKEEFAFWNIDMKDVVEPAKVTIWVGPNSQQGSEAPFTIQ